MAKVNLAVDALLDGPADKRIAIEGSVQRVAGAVLMHEKFAMT